MFRTRISLLLFLLLPFPMSAQSAFPPTDVGVSEFKTLPAGLLLKSQGRGNYFAEANGLFRPLFSYISVHSIAMTTPVEVTIEPAAMYFWVADAERNKVSGTQGVVEVVEVAERRVASLGARGSYSARNFAAAQESLLRWLESQTDVTVIGPPYAVFWNGPFTPGFLKRFEVHVPVRPAAGAG
jgi:hypothetical protein